jgi:demethylmenaquinone methyltransferase/2-methoxy-6-polyprenyl-1,4-benzoquinol methylase
MDFPEKDKAGYVRETFNSIAGRYDLMNTLMSLGMDKRWRRKVAEICRARPGMAVLDVCCGTGMLTRELAVAVGPGGRVTE